MTLSSNTFVIILAAGLATRLKPLSNRIPKPLVEINGKPIILRIISLFKDAGFSKFCILIGYKGDLVKKETEKIKRVNIEYVTQGKMTGMADAISLCIDHLNEKHDNISNFFVSASDIIISKQAISEMFKYFKKYSTDIILSLMKSHDIQIARGHGNVKISEVNKQINNLMKKPVLEIMDVIEKPEVDQILSPYYSLPLYLFNQKIPKFLSEVPLSKRGEREFQDAIKAAILRGDMVRGVNIIEEEITIENIGKYHLTYLNDILKMNQRFMKGIEIAEIEGEYPTLIEPVIIKKGIKIGDNVLIGPNVIIGEDCEVLDNSELSNTILFKRVVITKEIKLNNCIVEEGIILPDKFKAKNCLIHYNQEGEIEIINFNNSKKMN